MSEIVKVTLEGFLENEIDNTIFPPRKIVKMAEAKLKEQEVGKPAIPLKIITSEAEFHISGLQAYFNKIEKEAEVEEVEEKPKLVPKKKVGKAKVK